MKMLWIGSYCSDELFAQMPVKSIGQASGVTSQKSIINGLDEVLENTGIIVDTLNVQGIPVYPKYPDKSVQRYMWSRNPSSVDVSVGFRNTRFWGIISKAYNLKKEAKYWIDKNKNEEEIQIFVYEPVLSRLVALKSIKKHHKNIKCHLIVPDIPEYVGKNGGRIFRFLKQIRKMIVDRYLKYVDDYIFYAEEMANYYHVEKDKYMVMEGSIDSRDVEVLLNNSEQNNDFVLMYSGAISSQRAIPQFLSAFSAYQNNNIKLWFTGGGNCVDAVDELAKTDGRIVNHGFLDTREEVLSLESRATALLHIRDKNAVSSKYCFPSKMFEYMVSGKPVLSVRISGIPEEYYDYLIVIDSLTTEGIAEAISKIESMCKEEREAFGKRARDFVLKTKTSKYQAQRIIDFVLK